jgi:ankyrin repeat protein
LPSARQSASLPGVRSAYPRNILFTHKNILFTNTIYKSIPELRFKMVKLDENVKELFASMRSMVGKTISPAHKVELRAKVYRLIELLPIETINTSGSTLLVKAAEHGDKELVHFLLRKGANIEGGMVEGGLTPAIGLTPLMAASSKGHVEIMTILLDAGADIFAFSRDSANALGFAINSRNVEAVKLLITNGLTGYISNAEGTPLHTAAACNSAPILSLLIEHGVGDISAVDEEGRTALHHACCFYNRMGKDEIAASLAVLLDHGAAIDQLSRNGQSALYFAVDSSKISAVLVLLGRGANVALVDTYGQTALHKARSVEMVTALLAKGAPVNATDSEGKTALHCRAAYGDGENVPAARALLQAGADVNAIDKNGDAPLHIWAKDHYYAEVAFAQLLIDHGADVAAHNNANQRPSDVARTGSTNHAFLLAAEEAQRNNHRYKRPRLEDLQPPAAIVAGTEAAAAAEEEDESEDDSDDEDDDEDD